MHSVLCRTAAFCLQHSYEQSSRWPGKRKGHSAWTHVEREEDQLGSNSESRAQGSPSHLLRLPGAPEGDPRLRHHGLGSAPCRVSAAPAGGPLAQASGVRVSSLGPGPLRAVRTQSTASRCPSGSEGHLGQKTWAASGHHPKSRSEVDIFSSHFYYTRGIKTSTK